MEAQQGKQGQGATQGKSPKANEQVRDSGELTASEKTERILSTLDQADVVALEEHLESPKESCKDLSATARYALLLICCLTAPDKVEAAVKLGLGQDDKGTKPPTTIGEAVKRLKMYGLVAEAQQVLLTILTDLLPEIAKGSQFDVEARIAGHAETHDFATTWTKGLICHLEQSVAVLREFPTFLQEQAVAEYRKQIDSLVQKRTEIQKSAERFAEIINGLDIRTKIILLAGQELAALDGVNIGCFSDIWYSFRKQADDIVSELKASEFWQIDDLRFICGLYELADAIHSAE